MTVLVASEARDDHLWFVNIQNQVAPVHPLPHRLPVGLLNVILIDVIRKDPGTEVIGHQDEQ